MSNANEEPTTMTTEQTSTSSTTTEDASLKTNVASEVKEQQPPEEEKKINWTRVEDYYAPVVASHVKRVVEPEVMRFAHQSLTKHSGASLRLPTVAPSDEESGSNNHSPPASPQPAAPITSANFNSDQLAVLDACQHFLSTFAFTPQLAEIKFPPTMPRGYRYAAHQAAANLGLDSRGVGFRNDRYMCVLCPQVLIDTDFIYERFVDRGYVSFEGVYVDYLGSLSTPLVSEKQRKMRENRDGMYHHITIVSKPELLTLQKTSTFQGQTISEIIQHIITQLGEEMIDNFVEHGLGRLTEANGNQAYFRVIEWPQANAYRATLGLPPSDFHITVGFTKADIHNVKKDISTLITQEEIAAANAAATASATSNSDASASENHVTETTITLNTEAANASS